MTRVRTSTWLTTEFANELFIYRNGDIFWKKKRSNRCKAGEVGNLAPNGYVNVSVRVDGVPRTCGLHQLVWVLHGGTIKDDFEIDHKDHNRSNNKIENLRQATSTQNKFNKPSTSFGSWKGIYRSKDGVGWRVIVKTPTGTKEHVNILCIYDAATIYNFLIAEHYGEFAVYNQIYQPWLQRELKFS